VAAFRLKAHRDKREINAMAVVYIVVSGGGVESVWTTPLAAIEKQERMVARGHVTSSYTAVRPLDSDEPTDESKQALVELRKMEADRHNTRAQAIREGNRRRG
jgi:hypothetical protein